MIAIAYHAILSYLLLDLRIPENNDVTELRVNDELLGMISGTFDQSRTPRREHSDLPQLIVREDDEE